MIKIDDTIWHGFRYWKTEPDAGEIIGWNVRYDPWIVLAITPRKIKIGNAVTGDHLFLNRQTMELDGKQYHTRFHEYFFVVKPPPEKEYKFSWKIEFRADYLDVLGLSTPFTQADVRRAYKRLAKSAHPDLGGSHQAFIKLKQAHDSALRFAQ